MKKLFYLVLTIMMVVAIITIGVSLAMVEFDFNKLAYSEDRFNDEVDYVGIEKINVDVKISNVIVKTHNLDKVLVKYEYLNYAKIYVEKVEDRLIITQDPYKIVVKYRFVNNFVSFTERYKVEIFIPINVELSECIIKATTGNVTVNDIKCNFLDIITTTGDSRVEKVVCPKISIKGSTGNLRVSMLETPSLDINITTGDIRIDTIKVDDLKVSSTTGNIRIDNSVINDLVGVATTGNINFNKTTINKINVNLTTGNITFVDVLFTNSCLLKTTTGNVTIRFNGEKISDYRFNLHTTTGNRRVFNKTNSVDYTSYNGSLLIQASTTTGNIRIYFN